MVASISRSSDPSPTWPTRSSGCSAAQAAQITRDLADAVPGLGVFVGHELDGSGTGVDDRALAAAHLLE